MRIKPTRSYPDSFLQAMRQASDPEADKVIENVFQVGGMPLMGQLMAFLGSSPREIPVQFPPLVQQFFKKKSVLPKWANTKLLAAGHAFFRENQATILYLLGFLSLPYCYAGADGAQVLYMSQRIQRDTQKRLEETGAFVLAFMHPTAFAKGGAGFTAILKVRLMHAAIRLYTLKSGKWNPEWGMPINQDDMLGTNLAFSYVVIRGLRKMIASPSEEESEAYLHLWNVVGYILGIREDLLPANLREAYILDKSVARRNFRASEAGQALTKALLKTIESATPNGMLKKSVASQVRLLLGNTIADILGIADDPLAKYLVKPFQRHAFIRLWSPPAGQMPSPATLMKKIG